MELTAKELYLKKVRLLSLEERLLLAAMILNDITADKHADFSDSWTEQDVQDLTAFALSHSENPHEKHRNKP